MPSGTAFACSRPSRSIHPTRYGRITVRNGGKSTVVSWHDLRYTYTTWGRLAGMKAETMRDQLGHSSVLMTLDVYSHAQDRSGEAVMIEHYAWPKLATEVRQ